MIVVAEQKLSSHSVTFSSSKLHLGMQGAGFLPSRFWSVSILGGSCQQKRYTQNACKCIFMQLGDNYTSDEGEDWPAEFALLLIFAAPPLWFPHLIGDGASACVITRWICWHLLAVHYGYGCFATSSSQTPDDPKHLFTASCFFLFNTSPEIWQLSFPCVCVTKWHWHNWRRMVVSKALD